MYINSEHLSSQTVWHSKAVVHNNMDNFLFFEKTLSSKRAQRELPVLSFTLSSFQIHSNCSFSPTEIMMCSLNSVSYSSLK